MTEFTDKLNHYLQETLGKSCKLSTWDKSKTLPFFLQEQYSFYEGKIIGQTYVFVCDLRVKEETPATISKHIKFVMNKDNHDVVYVREGITSYNRKRLIGHKIPFIVPENQMYLPPLGIDLREYFKTIHQETFTLAPATQAVLLYCMLYHSDSNRGRVEYTPNELCTHFGYSRMTISRVCKELISSQLWKYHGTSQKSGKYRLCLDKKDELWEIALPLLKNPVKSRCYVISREGFSCKAGLSALSDYSMIGEPKNRIVAVSSPKFKKMIKDNKIKVLPMAEPDAIEVEVWSYDPTRLTSSGVVDQLSLYISLKESNDERIQIALDEMMRDIRW
jgi:hypothetical protein